MNNTEREAMRAALLLACLAASSVCAADWSKPGVKPYMLSVPSAVDNYKGIPASDRKELQRKMAVRETTATVLIKRNTIEGEDGERWSNLRDMHFGEEKKPRKGLVTRSKWNEAAEQRAFVYCSGVHCVAVPFICRNVSRIDRVVTAGGLPPSSPTSSTDGPVALVQPLPAALPLTDGPTFATHSEQPVLPVAPWSLHYPSYPVPIGGSSFDTPSFPPIQSPVPEPETWLMFALGAGLLAAKLKRKSP